MNENQAFGRVIQFWMRKVRDLRIKLAVANGDYADLLADYQDLNDLYLQAIIDRSNAEWRTEELEAAQGRSEHRRYQP